MPAGGRRPGAGRKPGIANQRTREIADRAAEDGITPLEYLLSVVRDEAASRPERLDAAKAAAPFIHPRLSSIDMKADQLVRISEVASKEQRDAAVAASLRADR